MEYDGTRNKLDYGNGFWKHLLKSVKEFNLIIVDVEYQALASASPNDDRIKIPTLHTCDHMRPLSSSTVTDLDITIDHLVQRPYFWIAATWPMLESLRVTFVGRRPPKRNTLETTDLIDLKYLERISLPWMYGTTLPEKISLDGVHCRRTTAEPELTQDELETFLERSTRRMAKMYGLERLEYASWRCMRERSRGAFEVAFSLICDEELSTTDFSLGETVLSIEWETD
ncbi:hypothetical protein TWF696_005857 [Orbilia brochopaga]|uniref:Uncharacterized protein n=1 Tax=Orbilia brochopaga TaxID=3140254 RepID=A0AAV9UUJ9_9PEZI